MINISGGNILLSDFVNQVNQNELEKMNLDEIT